MTLSCSRMRSEELSSLSPSLYSTATPDDSGVGEGSLKKEGGAKRALHNDFTSSLYPPKAIARNHTCLHFL